jgi:hypothetical protein
MKQDFLKLKFNIKIKKLYKYKNFFNLIQLTKKSLNEK